MFYLFLSLVIIFIIGFSISRFFLGDKLSAVQIVPAFFVVGLIVMGYFVLFASLLIGNFSAGVWMFMALGGAYSLYFGFRNINQFRNYINLDKWNTEFFWRKLKQIPWAEVIFFLAFIIFFFDIFTKTIVYQDGAYKVAVAGYGDIPFHMAEVSYFIHSTPFGLEEPIYAGTKLVYAFLINLLSAVFYIISGNYILSFNLPAHILLFTGFFFVYKFISAFIKTALMRILAFFIFLLGSGVESLRVFHDPVLWGKSSVSEMINYLLHLPYPIANFYNAVYPAQNNVWSSFMTMFLMHQRSFFFGFAAGAMILYFLIMALKSEKKRYFYFIGLLIGFLPLVHMHTFIAVLVIAFGFFVWNKFFAKDNFLAKNLFIAIGIGAIIGGVITYFFILDFSSGASFVTYRLGWMSEPGIGSIKFNPAGGELYIEEWLAFIWENFGLLFPLLAIAIAYFVYKKNKFWQEKHSIFGLILGAILLFSVVNTIKFQPWDYDNGKIFGYFVLLASIIIIYFFEQWKFWPIKIIAIILTFFMISIGLIDAFSRSSYAKPTLYEIFGVKEQKAADWIIENTSSDERILTGSSHLNLVDSLAGRPVLMGYPGWLWTHGIKYGEREKDIAEIYKGGANIKELLKKYNIKYIFIGSNERYNLKPNEKFFDQNYPVVFQEKDIKIYLVSS